jgi:hypothetical protein
MLHLLWAARGHFETNLGGPSSFVRWSPAPKKEQKDSPPGTLGPDLAKYVDANGNAYGIKGRPDISAGTWRWLCVKPSDKEGWLAARFLRIPTMIACRICESPGHSGGSLS